MNQRIAAALVGTIALIVGIGAIILDARQEHPAKPIQIWEVATKTFDGPGDNAERLILVYKFQVGDRRVCKAIFTYTTDGPTSLGEVPCDE